MQLAVALNLRNQSVTIEINNRSLDMNRESVDDNATVRVVTLVTLTYLPASFVSVRIQPVQCETFSNPKV